jgi:hypothetical protein
LTDNNDEPVDGVAVSGLAHRETGRTDQKEPADRVAGKAGGDQRADEGAGNHADEEEQTLILKRKGPSIVDGEIESRQR